MTEFVSGVPIAAILAWILWSLGPRVQSVSIGRRGFEMRFHAERKS